MNKILDNDYNSFIKNVNVPENQKKKLVAAHTNISEQLKANDSTLKKHVLETLLSGSFKKNTIVKSGKKSEKKVDVDIIVIYDFDKEDISPQTLIDKTRNEIDKIHDYEGKTRIQKRSVGIELSTIHIDIIPVLRVNENKNKPLYISEIGKQKWVKTNPIKSIEYINNQCSKKKNFRNYVKTFKWWKKENKPVNVTYPISYAFETLCVKYYKSKDNKFYGFLKTMCSINQFLQSKPSKPILLDPCGSGNDLFKKMDQSSYNNFRNKFNDDYIKMKNALDKCEIGPIREVLGYEFPNCIIDCSNKK